MQLTKEILQAKRLLAIRTRDELTAKLNAEHGVIATFDHLIALIETPEPIEDSIHNPAEVS